MRILHKVLIFKLGICNVTNTTLLTSSIEVVNGLWNTTAGGPNSLATLNSGVRYYPSSEGPQNALDQTNKKYLSFGNCAVAGANQVDCGINSGFYVTPKQGATLPLAIQFITANDAHDRDPLSITVEGTNATSSALMLGTSWSLIYTGATGLNADPGRQANGQFQCISNSTIWYTSYRVLVTSKRGVSNSVQYSEVNLFGHENPKRGKNVLVSEFYSK